jgi:hypothetical protein
VKSTPNGRATRMRGTGEVLPTSSGSTEYAPTYFPGVTDTSQAPPLKLAAGSEFRKIDITLRSERVYSVAGKYPPDSSATVMYSAQISARNQDRAGEQNIRGFGMSRTGSEFRFNGLVDGSYIVTVARVEREQYSYAQQAVEVAGADVEGINLSFQPAKDVSGVVKFEGGPVPTGALQNLRVSLLPEFRSGMYVGSTQVKPDGSFAFKNIPPMEIELTIGHVNGAYLKSIQVGERVLPGRRVDFSQAGGKLTVVMGTDMGDVAGTVQHKNGEPAARVRVTVVPYGAILGRTELSRFAFTRDDGSYEVKEVAPGEYKVFAWEDVPMGAPQDPEFRKPFENMGLAIKLPPTGHATAALTAIQTREQSQ